MREAALEYILTGNREALDYGGRQIDRIDQYFREHPVHRPQENHPYWSEAHVCLAGDLCRDGLDDQRLAKLKRLVHDKFLDATHTGWDAPLVVRNASGHRVFRAEIEHGEFTDTVIAALDHSLIKFPDVTGYAEIAVIRRATFGQVLDRWTLGGYPLAFR